MLTVEELGEEIATLSVHLDAARHRLLQCIRQFDESRGWYAQGAVSCAHWLSWRIGLDLGTAREKVRVANALGQLPKIDEALRVGKLSYAKVRALTRVATAANEAKLLDLALAATGAQLERICRGYRGAMNQDRPCVPEDRSVRKRLLPGGMVKLEIVLSADEAGLVMRAVDCAREISAETPAAESGIDESPAWPSRPDGVVALAAHYLAGNRGDDTGADRYRVTVHVGQDPLAPDLILAATLQDGTALSARMPVGARDVHSIDRLQDEGDMAAAQADFAEACKRGTASACAQTQSRGRAWDIVPPNRSQGTTALQQAPRLLAIGNQATSPIAQIAQLLVANPTERMYSLPHDYRRGLG